MPNTATSTIIIEKYYQEKFGDGINLYVGPREVVRWEDFIEKYPAYSVGLDGFVFGKPQFHPEGPHANFNHHEEVDRLGTRATCAQIQVALKQGFMDRFQDSSEAKMNIFVNDPDQDTALSVWLLKNHERVSGLKSEPLINRLIGLEDLLDVTAGAYPIDPNSEILREIAWIFEPYTASRTNGRLFNMKGPEMANIITAVGARISDYTLGRGKKAALQTDYERIGGGNNWAMLVEDGAHARTAIFASGIRAFVAVRENENGTYTYSIGKMSPYINFPLDDFYTLLNRAENISPDSTDSWGGSDIIGGSPREAGSNLKPEEIEKILNGILRDPKIKI